MATGDGVTVSRVRGPRLRLQGSGLQASPWCSHEAEWSPSRFPHLPQTFVCTCRAGDHCVSWLHGECACVCVCARAMKRDFAAASVGHHDQQQTGCRVCLCLSLSLTYTYAYAYTYSTRLHIRIHVHIHIHIHTHTHIHMHAQICTHPCLHAYLKSYICI